jgi:hypothetical protein
MFKRLGQKANIVVFGITLGCITTVLLVSLGAQGVVQTMLVFVGSAVATFVTMQMAGESITGGKTSSTFQGKAEEKKTDNGDQPGQ